MIKKEHMIKTSGLVDPEKNSRVKRFRCGIQYFLFLSPKSHYFEILKVFFLSGLK